VSRPLLFLLCGLGVLCGSVAPSVHAASGRPDRTLYYEAKAAQTRLQKSKTLVGRKAEWDKVILRFRSIVGRYPQSPYCDDALLAVGDMYRLMAERFKTPRYKDDAARAYRMLVGEYPSSSLGEGALHVVFEMATESNDRRRIEDAAQLYLAAFPDSRRASAVKAAVRRKATPEQAAALPAALPRGLVPVFNLRSWSGENSTRIVVDLGREVKFRSDRIANPDRLWVDLPGTRLHPNLTDRVFPVGDGLLEQVRLGQNRDNVVRVVLDFKSVKDHQVFYLQNPTRLVVDVRGNEPPPARIAARTTLGEELEIPDLESPEPATALERQVEERLRVDSSAPPPPSPTPAPAPTPLTLLPPTPVPPPVATPVPTPVPTPTPTPRPTPTPSATPAPPAQVASATALEPAPVLPPAANRTGSYSLARQLGLGARRIVIDAGHGGHDPGTIGRGGLQEKDLVLDVAQRLARLVREELGADVLMTRASDVFIPLEERTAIANQKDADLFLSIHANSSRSPRARGIETYYLNFAGDPHAEEVAARENAISPATMKDLQGLVKAIALNSKIDESRDFASAVHESLVDNLRRTSTMAPDRGVKTAPFYVLIGANMPSILAEIAFVSNPEDEKLLRGGDRREEIARGLLSGVRSYLEGLNRGGVKLTRGGSAPRLAVKGVKR